MAQSMGALMVDIGANVARLQRDMDKAQRVFKTSTDRIKRVAASTGVAIGAAFSIRGISQGIKEVLDYGDAVSKTASKIGLQVEALQELRYAAELTGVEQRTLDMAMQRFSRRVGEAAQGGGELKSTLEEYNIAVRNSDGSTRSLDAVLGDLADTIAGAESDQERLRIAFKAFDSEGAKLVNTLRDGSAGLGTMREEARRFGHIVTEESAAAAVKLNGDILRLTKSMEGLQNQVVFGLVPAMSVAAEELLKFVAPTLNQEIASVEGAIKSLEAAFAKRKKGRGGAYGFLDDLSGAIFDNEKQAEAMLESLYAKRAELQKRFEMKQMQGPGFWELQLRDSAKAGEVQETIERVTKTVDDYWAALQRSKNSTFFDETKKFEQMYSKEQHDRIMKQWRENRQEVESYTSATIDFVDDANNKYQELEYTAGSVFTSMEDAIVDFTMNGKGSFKDFVDSAIADLTRLAVQQSITNPLFEFLSTAGPALLGSIGGPGPSTFTTSAPGPASYNGNVFSRGRIVPHFNGGLVNSPAAFPMANGSIGTMAEKGTEAIMPLKRIGGKLGVYAQGGGQTVQQTFNVDARGSSVSAADLEAAVRKGARAGYDLVYTDLQRRGPIRKAI